MDSTPLERFVFEFELSDKEPNFTNEELERRFADFLLKLAIISTNVNTTIGIINLFTSCEMILLIKILKLIREEICNFSLHKRRIY